MPADATMVKCSGEAHGPDEPYIDHCLTCAPFWREYPACEQGHKLNVSKPGLGYCSRCKRYFRLPAKAREQLEG